MAMDLQQQSPRDGYLQHHARHEIEIGRGISTCSPDKQGKIAICPKIEELAQCMLDKRD